MKRVSMDRLLNTPVLKRASLLELELVLRATAAELQTRGVDGTSAVYDFARRLERHRLALRPAEDFPA